MPTGLIIILCLLPTITIICTIIAFIIDGYNEKE